MLGEFVAATAPRPPPPPPFKGYDPVFEAHYPKFYKVLYDFSFLLCASTLRMRVVSRQLLTGKGSSCSAEFDWSHETWRRLHVPERSTKASGVAFTGL